tara:strand:- start:269 stop:781 length:513 start_codon:yes stop_codon:yes gene_type:complete
MINTQRLAKLCLYTLLAHDTYARTEKKRFRKWDQSTPYAIHPLWCAMTILTETSLNEGLRVDGAEALILHDTLEDTYAALPSGTSDRVAALVEAMTFDSAEQERECIWQRSTEVQLLKLYDKVSNLLDGSWMNQEKRRVYETYVERLCIEVEKTYGTLNITNIARSVIFA